MRKVTSVIIVLSFVLFLVSFWNRNNKSGAIDYVDAIADEPQQTRTTRRPFDASWNDVDYLVEPEYDLEGFA